jgi:hypothetical protein
MSEEHSSLKEVVKVSQNGINSAEISDRKRSRVQVVCGWKLTKPVYYYAEWKTTHWELKDDAPNQDW